MKKSLLIAPIAVISACLFSCNKNTYTITSKNAITFTSYPEEETHESFEISSYGYTGLNIKKDVTYTFIYDLGSAPLEYQMAKEIDKYFYDGLFFDFKVDVNNSSVKHNDKLLTGKGYENEEEADFYYGTTRYGFTNVIILELGRVKYSKGDKFTFTLKASETKNDVTVCGNYADD